MGCASSINSAATSVTSSGCTNPGLPDLPEPLSPISLEPNSLVHACLDRQSGKNVGLTLKEVDGKIMITTIHQCGLVYAWNIQNPTAKLHAGDIVTSVNGKQGDPGNFWDVAADLWGSETIQMEVLKSPRKVRRQRERGTEFVVEHKTTKKCSVPVERLQKLPAVECSATECAICCSEFDQTTKVLQLNCGHAFHPTCIGQWLVRGHESCPMCRDKKIGDSTQDEVGGYTSV